MNRLLGIRLISPIDRLSKTRALVSQALKDRMTPSTDAKSQLFLTRLVLKQVDFSLMVIEEQLREEAKRPPSRRELEGNTDEAV